MQEKGTSGNTLNGAIAQLIAEYLSGPEGAVSHDQVRRANALPVYNDIGGSLLITPEAEILALRHEGADRAQPEVDPRWRQVAFARAAERFPQLAALLPRRPPDAMDCPRCGAEGVVQAGTAFITCAECSGLGWKGSNVSHVREPAGSSFHAACLRARPLRGR